MPPLAIWAITRLLESQRVADSVDRADRRIESRKKRAGKAFGRARRNARSNPLLLTAGMVAIVAGIGLVIKAAMPPE